jgi:septum formation protein
MSLSRIILASASPRRKLLLTDAGYSIEVDPSNIDEPEPPVGTPVVEYVSLLAWKKAHAVAARRKSGLILAADTACAVMGEILNKPIDRADAERMIRLQEGRDTEVVTGICLYRADRGEWVGAAEVSVVRFEPLTDADRNAFLDTDRWEGKAGAYGVQDYDPWVAVTRGSWSNVVGLPMERLDALLKSFPSLTDGL